ncbi:sugar porter (SP) family MFS transporter [Actinopolyspora biskrensis]|uniref:Sugar porter (SP) family MFS transporter n=1 Tax=Actinopolyspora biskrensis TaxID=1470178 RepID=A0A852Z3S6_9ACTN|nr:sugar porter family MFS transporter [Actinopolyspora biskrensis]NYH80652.1 sugar porter (SP) family MFS transporter [Actinopolyspora biskrensis]
MKDRTAPTPAGNLAGKKLVLRSAVIAALGGLLFGFDTAVVSGTTEALKRVFSLGGAGLGFTVATALIGTIVGAAATGLGKPADRIGRKKVLYAIGILYMVSALGSALAPGWVSFMVMRFVGGIGVGAAAAVAPIYNAEVAPPKLRGRMVGLFQFNIVLGILLAYLSNYVVLQVAPDATAWRWMFGVEALPALAFVLLLALVPESPRWLMKVGRVEEADRLITVLASDADQARLAREEIIEANEADHTEQRTTFFARPHRKIILLAFAIAAFNQLSGINAVLYYAPSIFESAGMDESASFLSSAGVGLINLISTMLALVVIDRLGRRKLMLVGSFGYLLTLGVLAVTFLSQGEAFSGAASLLVVVMVMLFVAAHAFGQGAVIWVFISEIFPTSIRARGQAFGSLTHWGFAAAISWIFPLLAEAIGGGTAFTFFFVCMVGQLVWVLLLMPETKGVPLEEMKGVLGLRHSPDSHPDAGRSRGSSDSLTPD